MKLVLVVIAALAAAPGTSTAAPWAAPVAPVIPGTDGYVAIPHAAVTPLRTRIYRAIFNATLTADRPGDILPALDMAGSELNVLAGAGVSPRHAKFAVVFHGPAIDGILDDAHYMARHGVHNPNLKVIADLKRAGVQLFVCGQNLAFENIDPKTLTPDVAIALDALIVLMTFQQNGYALMSY
jgi:intracellular sulfur oxidation DsrE/DsrF family protein